MSSKKVVGLEPLMTIDEVSAYLRIPVPTLYRWRTCGKGPEAALVGRHLRYEVADVRQWLHGQKAAA